MLALHSEAAKAIDWSDGRFDARVEITSPAASVLRAAADELVDLYLTNSELVFEEVNPYVVGSVQLNPAKAKRFEHALHGSYSFDSDLEEEMAEAIDATGFDWARNPANGGYNIPLLDKGDTRRFFPDFLVWKDGMAFAIDPKGGHLLKKDAGRKLLNIRDEKGQRKVAVRLIAEGKWNEQVQELGKTGYTVWSAVKATGQPKARHVQTVADAVATALKG
jgi:type III restriction enzyme